MSLQNTQGFWPVAAAVGGNIFVTTIKFLAAAATGSSAMLSEAIHSLADSVNQVLLLIGLGRSTKQADSEFEYGYGNERFFWAIISACGVLFVGAGVTAYSGIFALVSPYHIEFSYVVFVVLALSFVIEGYTFLVALQAIARAHPVLSWRARIAHADPSTLAVLLEDAVAVFGIVVASISIMLSYYSGNVVWDAAGSLVISALLGAVAVTLIMKNRSYLIGKTMPEEMGKEVIAFLEAEPTIETVIDFKSQTIGFGVYRIKCEVEFNGTMLLEEIWDRQNMHKVYEDASENFESFKRFLADYADRIPRLMGSNVDAIEARIKQRYPAIQHIDIEIN
jgi:zinc transporter 9